MSSHREAPAISKDPVADSTDLYAFRSPDNPDTVTIIANYLPLQLPAGGPNFYEFGDEVLYEIHIANHGEPLSNITYQFQFHTELTDPNSFLYNTGQITSLDSPNWNRRQFYTVTRIDQNGYHELAQNAPCPPSNVGPRSIPHYGSLADAAVVTTSDGEKIFAGQRAEGFYVDLGSIFDLGDLRPFSPDQLIPGPASAGVNATAGLNVASIAIQVPITLLTHNGSMPTSVIDPAAVLGIWTSANRQKVRVFDQGFSRQNSEVGPFVQVSRLGNPLFNEVIVPIGRKDLWNTLPPFADQEFLSYVQHPELGSLLPVLYPGVFPNLATYTSARADLVAILLTGIPTGVVDGLNTYTGPWYADMLRLNVAIPPSSSPSILGVLGGDLAGYPNGRRVFDDVVSIALRAIAGTTIRLVDQSYVPDKAAGAIYDVINPDLTSPSQLSSIGATYLASFPYLGIPWDGFSNPSTTPTPSLVNP
ncbi:DUF4331 domain-containing protein [Ferrimicrobium sp.]|uniref:DUF4331 domain-containing protein n=1 Tax=Ferrimicrobium sp. TaxID=2926050 RepID=UPI0026022B9C|nr:DUF4331 domain-containing protein [Ferrimicrobium sp.]